MAQRNDRSASGASEPDSTSTGHEFASSLVDRIRNTGNVWKLPQGQLRLPRVFGFCRGVTHALDMLQRAVAGRPNQGGRLFLLGEIIHNPWVNDTFRQQDVTVLTDDQLDRLDEILAADDTAVIPAFGVTLPIQKQLERIGCAVIDTSCGDVRRLWRWADRAASDGYGIVIFGRATHDETVVTKSRLEAVGGKYVVVGDVAGAGRFCDLIVRSADDAEFRQAFTAPAANADSLSAFQRVAQVSQTTMLYEETLEVRHMLQQAMAQRFGAAEAEQRLLFEPTVCRATQDRQTAAIELCRSGVDVVVVVGGFGSSNTRHLFELARGYAPSYFIENAAAIRSADEILALDPAAGSAAVTTGWLPAHRPVTIGILAGASCPEIVIGEALHRLAELLG